MEKLAASATTWTRAEVGPATTTSPERTSTVPAAPARPNMNREVKSRRARTRLLDHATLEETTVVAAVLARVVGALDEPACPS